MSVYHMSVVPVKAQLQAAVLSCVYWELLPDPVQEQPESLTHEPSLHPHAIFFIVSFQNFNNNYLTLINSFWEIQSYVKLRRRPSDPNHRMSSRSHCFRQQGRWIISLCMSHKVWTDVRNKLLFGRFSLIDEVKSSKGTLGSCWDSFACGIIMPKMNEQAFLWSITAVWKPTQLDINNAYI